MCDILKTLLLSSGCQLEWLNIKARSHLMLQYLCCLMGLKHFKSGVEVNTDGRRKGKAKFPLPSAQNKCQGFFFFFKACLQPESLDESDEAFLFR